MVYVFFLHDPLLFWLDSIRQNEVTDRRSWEAYVKEKMEQVPIIDAKKSTLCKKENNLHKKVSHKTEQKSQQVCFFFRNQECEILKCFSHFFNKYNFIEIRVVSKYLFRYVPSLWYVYSSVLLGNIFKYNIRFC